MPSISMIICWSALASGETNKAIRKDIKITIICFMVICFLLINVNQHTLKRYGKDESPSANPKYATGDFPRTEILLAAAVLFF
jgi:ACR3 family arsenite efflux pump ArsB